ncbi:hypothetical protein SRHO_G00102030 [Serrasalmus rhombeus]
MQSGASLEIVFLTTLSKDDHIYLIWFDQRFLLSVEFYSILTAFHLRFSATIATVSVYIRAGGLFGGGNTMKTLWPRPPSRSCPPPAWSCSRGRPHSCVWPTRASPQTGG